MANITVRVIDGIVDGVPTGKDVTIDEVHVERLVKAGFIAQPEEAEFVEEQAEKEYQETQAIVVEDEKELETEKPQEKAPAKKATTKKKAE
ncbi:hypothetical protein [Listeria booriae]|uniref:hypothetical protein n=1 Tax=Listeria booriae TaxID=1552123 RepID=UPI00162485B7|nr:hypothetical protein [Listeria booriae]MBC2189201.1 hypothetical protein [Listeria booriae]